MDCDKCNCKALTISKEEADILLDTLDLQLSKEVSRDNLALFHRIRRLYRDKGKLI